MATITIKTELDVINKYKELVTNSLDGDSVYIRTKETLQELFNSGTLTNTDKATVITQVIGALNQSVVQTSMTTALQWASAENSIALKKLELEKQLDILDQDILLKKKTNDNTYEQGISIQAERIRMYGVPTVVNGKVTSLSPEGKVYNDIEILKQQLLIAQKDLSLKQASIDQTYAATHKIVADTYWNYGSFSYNLSANALTAVTDTNTGGIKPLSKSQQEIAAEQAKGYAYNAWANATSAISSTVGVALSSELPIFNPGGDGRTLLDNLINITSKLKDVPVPSI